MIAVIISARATKLAFSRAVPDGGRASNDAVPQGPVMASAPIRDEIAAQLWARGYPKVCLSRSNIKGWAMAPEPRRQS